MYYSNINTLASLIESDYRISFDSPEVFNLLGGNQTESKTIQSLNKKALNIQPRSLEGVAKLQHFCSVERLSDASIAVKVIFNSCCLINVL